MKNLSILIIVMLLGSYSSIAVAQWELEKNEDGIKVYTRSVANSNFKEFRAEIELECSADKVIRLLKDANNFKKWLHNCNSSSLLKKISDDEQYNYTETVLPFPFENRDMIFRAQFSEVNNNHLVTLTGVPDYIKKKDKITRMEQAKGRWEIINIKDNKILVRYQLWVEPGGAIPSWLANLKVVEVPYETLKNMRKKVLD